jgi:hypothetical protein
MSRYEDETKEFRELEREKMRMLKKLLKRKNVHEEQERKNKEMTSDDIHHRTDVAAFEKVSSV